MPVICMGIDDVKFFGAERLRNGAHVVFVGQHLSYTNREEKVFHFFIE